MLWAERPGKPFVGLERRHRVLLIGEFFNRSVGDVYELGSPLPYKLPSTSVQLAPDGRILAGGSSALLGDLVLVPCYVQLTGRVRAADAATGAKVVEVGRSPTVTVASPDSCGVR